LTTSLVEGARTEFRKDEVQFNERGNAEKAADRELRLAEHEATWPPEQIGYLWDWFSALTDWRQQTMGVGPLSHLEMEAWARLMRIEISPFEVEVLRMLDRECRQYYAEKSKDEDKPRSVGESLQRIAESHKQQALEQQGRQSISVKKQK
jgi:hypothetical protein